MKFDFLLLKSPDHMKKFVTYKKNINPLCENSDFATNRYFLHEKFAPFYLGEVRIHGFFPASYDSWQE